MLTAHIVLTDGESRIGVFDSEQDATNALAVAQRHTSHCFIGRRPSKPSGIELVDYWSGQSTMTPSLTRETCTIYDWSAPKTTAARDRAWAVTDDGAFTIIVSDRIDAAALLAVAQRYRAHSTLGRATPRAGPIHYS